MKPYWDTTTGRAVHPQHDCDVEDAETDCDSWAEELERIARITRKERAAGLCPFTTRERIVAELRILMGDDDGQE